MTDNVENLLLEHMKRFQATLERLERKIDEGNIRTTSVDGHVVQLHKNIALIHDDIAGVHVRLDNLGRRFERIERRLDLTDSVN